MIKAVEAMVVIAEGPGWLSLWALKPLSRALVLSSGVCRPAWIVL